MKKEFLQEVDDLTKKICKEFHDEFVLRLPGVGYEYSSSDKTDIRIPALNRNFGDIEIRIWYREITVLIGDRFHTHFDIDISRNDITNNNAKEVICEVIEFIEDVVYDKILLRVKMQGERVISSSIVDEDNINEPIESMSKLSGFLRGVITKKSKFFYTHGLVLKLKLSEFRGNIINVFTSITKSILIQILI